jgi:UDP-N-acetylglucosamine--N-acetylmuramyl-(pentapeptide) pyrophosphoryl-undecaprenol N-acetylglucosamine transferase
VGFAAAMRGVPLVLHEQNSVPGLANRALSRWARAVAVTYEESAAMLAHPERVVLTGNPVRPAVLGANRASGREALGLPPGALVLLVFGGSRGARHLNSSVVALRDRLLAIPGLRVLHVTGAAEADAVREALDGAGGDGDGRWRVIGYLDDMGSALAASDLIVARAGATSIAEITALGLPAVLVPYPYATDDHQTKNAATMVANGAAMLVHDADLDDERFGNIVAGLLSDPSRSATMAAASRELGRPNAADTVAALARQVARPAAAPHESSRDTEDSVA